MEIRQARCVLSVQPLKQNITERNRINVCVVIFSNCTKWLKVKVFAADIIKVLGKFLLGKEKSYYPFFFAFFQTFLVLSGYRTVINYLEDHGPSAESPGNSPRHPGDYCQSFFMVRLIHCFLHAVATLVSTSSVGKFISSWPHLALLSEAKYLTVV